MNTKMDFIGISKDRIQNAVTENDKILLSYFHPDNRTPIKKNVKIDHRGLYIILDGKRYELTGQRRYYKII